MPMTYADAFITYLQNLPDSLVYILLGLSAFVENVFPPIPGDTITAFGAFLVGIGRLTFPGVYISTTLGSFVGFMSLFYIGRVLGRRFFVEKDYRFFRARDIRKAEAWFQRYGYALIALNRFLPGIRSAISVAGGISELRRSRVMILALLSCAVWNLLWIFLGYSLGVHWEIVRTRITAVMLRYNAAVAILLCLILAFFIIRKIYRK